MSNVIAKAFAILERDDAEEVFLDRIVTPAGYLDEYNARKQEIAEASRKLEKAPLKRWVHYLRNEFHGERFVARHQCEEAHELIEELARETSVRMQMKKETADNFFRYVTAAASGHDVARTIFKLGILYGTIHPEEDEIKFLKLHPYTSFSLLKKVKLMRHTYLPILLHEECWEGGGSVEKFLNNELREAGLLPDDVGYLKIAGEDIPLGASLLAIPDAYASMVRREKTPEEIKQMLLNQRGKKFNPYLTDLTLELLAVREI